MVVVVVLVVVVVVVIVVVVMVVVVVVGIERPTRLSQATLFSNRIQKYFHPEQLGMSSIFITTFNLVG